VGTFVFAFILYDLCNLVHSLISEELRVFLSIATFIENLLLRDLYALTLTMIMMSELSLEDQWLNQEHHWHTCKCNKKENNGHSFLPFNNVVVLKFIEVFARIIKINTLFFVVGAIKENIDHG
jgi:hypothetical protein